MEPNSDPEDVEGGCWKNLLTQHPRKYILGEKAKLLIVKMVAWNIRKPVLWADTAGFPLILSISTRPFAKRVTISHLCKTLWSRQRQLHDVREEEKVSKNI